MIRLDSVSKTYQKGQDRTPALDAVTLDIKKGEFVVVRGPSGSGKTTLLVLIAGMLRPSQGVIQVNQQDLAALSPQQKASFRASHIGFVFQMFHLVPYLSVLENVQLAAIQTTADRARAEELLENLGLRNKSNNLPSELSAGEKQRTAVARALINRPRILLADEPTGNLDLDSASKVIAHLNEFRQQGGTVVLASHSDLADPLADRLLELKQGRITEIPLNS